MDIQPSKLERCCSCLCTPLNDDSPPVKHSSPIAIPTPLAITGNIKNNPTIDTSSVNDFKNKKAWNNTKVCDECGKLLDSGTYVLCDDCYYKIVDLTTHEVMTEFSQVLRVLNKEIVELKAKNKELSR